MLCICEHACVCIDSSIVELRLNLACAVLANPGSSPRAGFWSRPVAAEVDSL